MPTITLTPAADDFPTPFANPWVRYVIYGLGGDDFIEGGGLGDEIYGGDGSDWLDGNVGNDSLYGDAGDDFVYGGGGADVLRGGSGIDQLNGDEGNDTLYGDSEDFADGGIGDDTIYTAGGIAFGFYGNDTLISTGNSILWGGDGNDINYAYGGCIVEAGAGNDIIYAMDGADFIYGEAGNDTMYDGPSPEGGGGFFGGTGNDIYVFQNGNGLADEAADEGYDIVRAWFDQSLDANVEALQQQGTANISGSGNAGANNMQGNSGDNRLYGDAGVDTINGNDGDDRITGGVGNDLLRGGSGADAFIVSYAIGATIETDQVYDFSAAEGDTVEISETYSLVSAFTKVDNQMTLSFASGITTLRVDHNGDGRADYQMKINGDLTGDTDWLVLT